jgi:hypothetical protein
MVFFRGADFHHVPAFARVHAMRLKRALRNTR